MTTKNSTFSVAVAQCAPNDDIQANISLIRRLATQALRRGARLIVFPEYCSYFRPTIDESFVRAAQSIDGPFMHAVSDVATSLRVWVIVGMLETTNDDCRFSNTVIAIAPSGELVAIYRKQHLYNAFGQRESDWVLPGALEDPQIFIVDGVKIGLQTCYDLRFPEVSRRLVDAGAEIILVPAQWVPGPHKETHWRTLVTARAVENTVFVVAADHPPPYGVGHSMIVDPMGVELARIGDITDIAVASVSAQRITAVRLLNPALVLRRYRVVSAENSVF
jgi:predicted amidohydrolase